MNITITITGLDDIMKRLNIDLMTVIKPAIMVVGEEVRDKIAVYPGNAHKPVIWASVKQRRWWFAHRREKGLPPGYTRNSDPESQRLGPSWTVEPTPTGAAVRTRALYAPWVQSVNAGEFGGPQTAQHAATGWLTDQSAVDEVVRSGVIKEIVNDAIRAALKV